MTERRNGVLIDERGAWTAACYLRTDPQFAGIQHGAYERGTLCGLSEDEVVIVRNPFYGTSIGDCTQCAERLQDLCR